jgi:hypothetical protein
MVKTFAIENLVGSAKKEIKNAYKKHSVYFLFFLSNVSKVLIYSERTIF